MITLKQPKPFKFNAHEKWFVDLLDQMSQATKPEYPNVIFFHIDGQIYMEYNQNSTNLWADYNTIWLVLQSKFDLNYEQIRDLIKGMVARHTNLRVATPLWC